MCNNLAHDFEPGDTEVEGLDKAIRGGVNEKQSKFLD
jgi:hypothetical protein